MPILSRQPDIFPDDLMEVAEERTTANSDQAWWALYTMSRREKKLMSGLARMEVPFYGPLIERESRSPSGRKRISHVPLFTGYVFIFGNYEQRQTALKTNCISSTIQVQDAVTFLADLRRIRQMVESGYPLCVEKRLEPGRLVRVLTGSLQGLEGTVISRHGQRRLLISVDLLQQGASVLLEDLQVDPIN